MLGRELSTSMHTLLHYTLISITVLHSDLHCGYDVARSLRLLPAAVTSLFEGLAPVIISHINLFSLELLLPGYFMAAIENPTNQPTSQNNSEQIE